MSACSFSLQRVSLCINGVGHRVCNPFSILIERVLALNTGAAPGPSDVQAKFRVVRTIPLLHACSKHSNQVSTKEEPTLPIETETESGRPSPDPRINARFTKRSKHTTHGRNHVCAQARERIVYCIEP